VFSEPSWTSAKWPDGRELVIVADDESPWLGDSDIISRAVVWLTSQGPVVRVTPTGPFVEPDDLLAMFAAVNAVEPGAEWTNAPDLTFGAPDGVVF